MIVGKTFRFEAAHYLASWPEDHKCHHMHGHSYKCEVMIGGPVQRNGAVLDFKVISDAFKEHVFNVLDHKVINEALKMSDATAEYVALWIYNVMTKEIDSLGEANVLVVKLWETEDAYAEVDSSAY